MVDQPWYIGNNIGTRHHHQQLLFRRGSPSKSPLAAQVHACLHLRHAVQLHHLGADAPAAGAVEGVLHLDAAGVAHSVPAIHQGNVGHVAGVQADGAGLNDKLAMAEVSIAHKVVHPAGQLRDVDAVSTAGGHLADCQLLQGEVLDSLLGHLVQVQLLLGGVALDCDPGKVPPRLCQVCTTEEEGLLQLHVAAAQLACLVLQNSHALKVVADGAKGRVDGIGQTVGVDYWGPATPDRGACPALCCCAPGWDI